MIYKRKQPEAGGGGRELFLAPLFLLNYLLFNLFLFLQEGGEARASQPLPLRSPWYSYKHLYRLSISFSSYIIIVKEGTTTDKGSSLNFTKKKSKRLEFHFRITNVFVWRS